MCSESTWCSRETAVEVINAVQYIVQSKGIHPRPGPVPDVGVAVAEVVWVAPEADGVEGGEAAELGIEVAQAVVVEAGLGVVLAAVPEVGVADGGFRAHRRSIHIGSGGHTGTWGSGNTAI